MEKKIALVTGATSGIGWATAISLAKLGFAIIATGRRKERLEQLKKELEKDGSEALILAFDVRDKNEVKKSLSALPTSWKEVDVLINNAGNAHGMDPIDKGSLEDWDAMIDINVKGLLYVSKEIIPGMVERKAGTIVNVGSIAGKEVYPNGNVYCASKHAVDAITNGMRQDLNPHGIRVTGVHPGLVETEFSLVRFKGDEERSSSVYKGFLPLTAEDIADTIAFAVSRPAHVVLADIIMLPTAQASATIVNKTNQ
ncbi:Oxidoreductase, short chain dehydrogenase/reductase family [Indibacter alkaliphilus LW1]|uniref:Oxidoreductase, short chain dehydrogenase/reductase family n=1 Tax=Indibacter alkaliphilus (strain CCUG 57479 / KCTC 22604 / LW1) TaxID=1189612 RepID=S2D086_INDAL|nr:SDR family NAD(P)-dependent oxidoreductase [Indibacter alkaliphilus]EOZ92284.1 Oxidoreductase, short chain dehydrogenase/reductase family [Indibacter alkaliphilus LW1]